MKTLIVKADDGKEYHIDDPNRFYQHLIDFHSDNSIGNNSVHEENGYYFTVTPSFYNIVNSSNLKKRLRKRQSLNRYDMFKFSFYNKVQKGFLILAKKNKKSLIVDSNRPMEKNKHVILNKVKKLLN